jgi:hypothetical protein
MSNTRNRIIQSKPFLVLRLLPFLLVLNVLAMHATGQVYSDDKCINGTAYAINSYSAGYVAGKAFDNIIGENAWCSLPSSTQMTFWIAYKFATPERINKVRIHTRQGFELLNFSNFSIQASNNSTNGSDGDWVTLKTNLNFNAQMYGWFDFVFDNALHYSTYRIIGPGTLYNWDSKYVVNITEIEMREAFSCDAPTLDFQVEELNGTHTFIPSLNGINCVVSYAWNFGDSTTSTDQAPTHSFSESGSFTVTMTASYTCGPCPAGQVTKSHEVVIENGFCKSIFCDGAGGVGIGTLKTEGFRLSVNGKIRASDIIKVYPKNQWADFVFQPGYNLLPLQEVQRFVKANGHLPGIPSASEVEKDGIDLGAMDAKLLQKVEELTLYLIELQNENRRLAREVEKLKTQNKK